MRKRRFTVEQMIGVLKQAQVVDSLLQLKKGATPKEIHENAASPSVSAARIKRYRNE